MAERFQSPMRAPYPLPKLEGDKRDIHDSDPSTNLTHPHERGRDTLPLVFKEGEDGGHGQIGRVVDTTPDILSSPMNGPRRSATGEREAELNKKQGF